MSMNAVIALDPQQMQDASRTMTTWADAKLAAAERDLAEADALHAQLLVINARPTHAKTLLNKAARRVRFYEKVKAAIAAGYYVIPPFNSLQVFAVRTRRMNPNADRRESTWIKDHPTEALAIGDGRYIDPQPVRTVVGSEIENKGTTHERKALISANVAFKDEINLPVVAMRPTIIHAVGRALEQKIFDALAIAPQYRNADPIIAGQIKRPDGGGTLNFLVAWWLDEADL